MLRVPGQLMPGLLDSRIDVVIYLHTGDAMLQNYEMNSRSLPEIALPMVTTVYLPE